MATNFLWAAGSTTSGFNSGLTSPSITLLSTEMVSLGSSGTVTSAQSGVSGLFTSSNTGQAIWGEIFVTLTTTATTVAGANVSGWFLTSPTSGTIIESTATAAISRPPDFIVPTPVATLGSSTTYKAAGLVRIPALNFKVNIQNNLGITLPSSASGNPVVLLSPVAMQY